MIKVILGMVLAKLLLKFYILFFSINNNESTVRKVYNHELRHDTRQNIAHQNIVLDFTLYHGPMQRLICSVYHPPHFHIIRIRCFRNK
jgi:hypothetical protein